VQQLVRNAVGEYCQYDIHALPLGVDGCSAPNFPIPLQNLAIGFMKLATGGGRDVRQKSAVTKIRSAMQEYPEMVSGEGRLDLAIMQSFPNRVVCKIGAEALEGIGFSDPPLGIAVKILDGASRALGTVCVEVLRQLGIVSDLVDFPHLLSYQMPLVENARRIVTGHIEAVFSLVRVSHDDS
jgi:L-asparaginase II